MIYRVASPRSFILEPSFQRECSIENPFRCVPCYKTSTLARSTPSCPSFSDRYTVVLVKVITFPTYIYPCVPSKELRPLLPSS